MMTRTPTIAFAAVLLAMGLGACSRSDDTTQAGNDPAVEATPTPSAVVEAPAPPSAPAVTAAANMTAEAPPEVAPAPDEQMMDDASATGMTARSSRSEPATDETTPVETAPVEQVEKK